MTRSMQHIPVRNKMDSTSLPPLQQPMRIKKQTASLAHRPFSTETPAEITQRTFTPTSPFHQSLRPNQTTSSTPLLASTRTQTAALSHLTPQLLHTPLLNTEQQMNQPPITRSELIILTVKCSIFLCCKSLYDAKQQTHFCTTKSTGCCEFIILIILN